jgi:hypothetical protein
LIFATTLLQAQETGIFIRDSIYCDSGVSGTQNFEPETRIYFLRHDEQGRTLEELRERLQEDGSWRPQTRRLYTYEGEHLIEMQIQAWAAGMNNWIDMRKDQYQYSNGLITEFVRQVAPNGQLRNDRRRSYTYDESGNETEVLLEQWTGNAWENLSRKLVEYEPNGDPKQHTLQVWMNEAWRNVRSREWQYENINFNPRLSATVVRVWSETEGAWEARQRKMFIYNNDGLWVRSRMEEWDAGSEEWVNTDRMIYKYSNQGLPTGQLLQRWDGEWENRGQVDYTFQNQQFISSIQNWDPAAEDWSNFLRFRIEYDEQNLLQRSTGMQAWDAGQMRWENRNFTQQYTHFWSQQVINGVEDREIPSACAIPNPYPAGAPFLCDLPAANGSYELELRDLLGRPVYRSNIRSGQSAAIDIQPAAGVYILSIRDQKQLYHLQKLVIN